jgi:hypothetical protein
MSSPDTASNPGIPLAEESYRPRSRRRHSRSGSSARGRIYLALFWLVLTFFHGWGYLVTADYEKREYLAHEAKWFIITTSLFTGAFCRQNWSRYLLIALLLFRLGATMLFIPTYTEAMLQSIQVCFNVLSGPTLNALIIWGLIAIPSIRRLVSRHYY